MCLHEPITSEKKYFVLVTNCSALALRIYELNIDGKARIKEKVMKKWVQDSAAMLDEYFEHRKIKKSEEFIDFLKAVVDMLQFYDLDEKQYKYLQREIS